MTRVLIDDMAEYATEKGDQQTTSPFPPTPTKKIESHKNPISGVEWGFTSDNMYGRIVSTCHLTDSRRYAQTLHNGQPSARPLSSVREILLPQREDEEKLMGREVDSDAHTPKQTKQNKPTKRTHTHTQSMTPPPHHEAVSVDHLASRSWFLVTCGKHIPLPSPPLRNPTSTSFYPPRNVEPPQSTME